MKLRYFDKSWLRIACSILIVNTFFPVPIVAMQNSTEGPLGQNFEKDLLNLPCQMLEDISDTVSNSDYINFLLATGAASIAMHNYGVDDRLDRESKRPQVFNGFTDESFNIIGSPGTHFALAGLWYALSIENNDDFNRQRSWAMIRALSATGLVTLGLKGMRHNSTPNGNRWAWPSGHTSSSFAVASVLDEFYGPQVGVPAYILASLVAYRMIDTGDHWTSDTVFGVALGWTIGHTVAGNHKKLELAGFEVLPYSYATNQGSAIGVNLYRRF